MTYTQRNQLSSSSDPDSWRAERHDLLRTESGRWMYSLSPAQLEWREADLRRSIEALRSFPKPDEFTGKSLQKPESTLMELRDCGGWCELDTGSARLIEAAYLEFQEQRGDANEEEPT